MLNVPIALRKGVPSPLTKETLTVTDQETKDTSPEAGEPSQSPKTGGI